MFEEIVTSRMRRVLGDERTATLLRALLGEPGAQPLDTEAGVAAFAEALASKGPIERAVAAMLLVDVALVKARDLSR